MSYDRVSVDAPPGLVVEAVRAALGARGITEYAVVDHGRDMEAAGAPGHVAWTLVFGNPAAGARLLDQDPAAAVDIPLRLAVIAGPDGGAEIVSRDMRTLIDGELADAFNAVLHALAEDARERAASPGGTG